MKKVLSLVLSLCLLLSTTPVGVAENPEALPEAVEVAAEVEVISETIEEPASEPAVETAEEPAEEPVVEATEEPAEEPAVEATEEPAEEPVVEPTEEPAEEPAVEPTEEPTEEPVVEPTEEPAEEPAVEPTKEPAEEPAVEPTEEPAEEPVVEPTEEPAEEPVVEPTEEPTEEPVVEPTEEPTEEPVVEPTEEPEEVVEDVVAVVEVALNTEELVNLSVLDAQELYSVQDALTLVLVADEGYALPEAIDVKFADAVYTIFGYTAEEIQEMLDAETLAEDVVVYCIDDGVVTIPYALLTADLAIIAEAVLVEVEEPAEEPAVEPTEEPAEEPVVEPTEEPTEEPAAEPSEEPAQEPAAEPSEEPAEEPAVEPSEEPTELPKGEVSGELVGEAEEAPSIEGTEELPAETPSSIVITAQPTNVTADIGEIIEFTVEATGAVSYRWQNSLDGAVWSNSSLDGSKTATISIPVKASRYPYLWRCVLTAEDGTTLETASVQILKPVVEETLEITKQPEDISAAVGDTITFSIEATGAAKYQWQNSLDGDVWNNSGLNGNDTPSLPVKVRSSHYNYLWRCVVTAASGNQVISETAQIVAPAYVEITQQPQSITASIGDTITFSVEASNVVSYQWQNSLDGEDWGNSGLEGNDTHAISIPVKASRYPYLWRCVLTGADGTKTYTDSVQILQPETAEFTKQPENVTAAVGDTISFTIEATGAAKYQWQNSLDGLEWSNSRLDGSTTPTLNVTVRSSHYDYLWRCVITAADGTKIESETAQIVKPAVLEITKQPTNVTAPVGETITFTVEAENVASYQWQNSLDGEEWTNSNLNGSTTGTITIPVKASRYNYLWRCVLTGADGTVTYTNSVKIIEPVEFVITKQPESITASIGDTIKFSVEATGVESYQWQNSLNGDDWANSGLEGNDAATITIPVKSSRYPYLWRCVLTSVDGAELITESVQILQPETAEFTKQPEDVTAAVGDTISFTIEATGAVKYQWQNSLDGLEWTNSRLSGSTGTTLNVTVRSSHYDYLWRCVITAADGTKVESETAQIVAPAYVEITKQPESITASIGDTITFTVEANNVVSYQWQNSLDGEDWGDSGLDGNDTAAITIPVKASRYPYLWRCVLTGADGSKTYTDSVQILQPEKMEITKQPEDVAAEVGETISLSFEATGVATYQWQNSLDGLEWTNSRLSGCKSDTLNVTVRSSHYDYVWRCVITSASGETLTTNTIKITANNLIVLDDVTYEKIDDKSLRVVSYAGTAASVTIPETVNGMTVTEIGESAFEGNTTLTSIDLPDTITVIGVRSFKDCINLSEMN